jgi:hypothetical protein
MGFEGMGEGPEGSDVSLPIAAADDDDGGCGDTAAAEDVADADADAVAGAGAERLGQPSSTSGCSRVACRPLISHKRRRSDVSAGPGSVVSPCAAAVPGQTLPPDIFSSAPGANQVFPENE